jgi:hypothetical protein
MSTYKSYPDSKTTPNRKIRKGDRNTVFVYNKTIARKLKKEARRVRQTIDV